MKARVLLAAALLVGVATAAFAQPGAGAGAAGAAAQPAAAGGNVVTINKKCCSIWDFLGVNQLGRFIDQNVIKTRLGQALQSVLGPAARAVGLGPSLLSDKFANEPGVMGLASKIKKEEKKAPLKVQAIKYLGTLDCNCYPEVIDALLASLDDCCEIVRYEALKALQNSCKKKHGCKKCDPKHGIYDKGLLAKHGDKCEDEKCCGCQCQKKVVDRLNDLLLERDETGCLKEKSVRVRNLATAMIEECLTCRQPPPETNCDVPATPTEPVRPVTPDPTPKVTPDPTPAPKARPDASTQQHRPFFKDWQRGQEALATEAKEQTPAEVQFIDSKTITVEKPISPEVIPTASSQTPANSQERQGGRRHLFGELFGY